LPFTAPKSKPTLPRPPHKIASESKNRSSAGWECAKAIDQQEDELCGPDKTGDELPADITDPEKRIKKLKRPFVPL
jgi:hypothetical protein